MNDQTRREFIAGAGRIAAATALAGVVVPRVHAAEDNTIRLALVGCGGRGTGAAANALSVPKGRVKLVAMADVFETSWQAATNGSTSSSRERDRRAAEDRKFIGFDAYRKAMDCLAPGDVVIFATPPGLPLGPFRLRHREGRERLHGEADHGRRPHHAEDAGAGRRFGQEEPQGGRRPDVPPLPRPARADRPDPRRARSATSSPCGPTACTARSAPSPRRPTTASERAALPDPALPRFLWASGGCYSDFHIHNIDECCWMKDAWPVEAQAQRRPALPRRLRRSELRQLLGRVHLRRRHQAVPRRPQHRRLPQRVQPATPTAPRAWRSISTAAHTRPSAAPITARKAGDKSWSGPSPDPEPNPYDWNGTT